MRRERTNRRLNCELTQIRLDYRRIVNHLHKLAQAGEGWSLLRVSDEFAAIERAAQRAKWRTYELYLWLGREEIKRQQKA